MDREANQIGTIGWRLVFDLGRFFVRRGLLGRLVSMSGQTVSHERALCRDVVHNDSRRPWYRPLVPRFWQELVCLS